MSTFECWSRLHEAMLDLATGGALPRQRLLSVAERHLAGLPRLAAGIGDRDLAEWIDRLTRRLQGGHNRASRAAIFATVNAMSDEEVDTTLIEIVALYDEATRREVLERALAA